MKVIIVYILALGMLFSGQIQQILDIMANAGTVAMVALALILAGLLALRAWRRRAFLREVEMSRISVDDLHDLISNGQAPIVIDVRSPSSVQMDARRIPGAMLVDLPAMRSKAVVARELMAVASRP